MNRSDVITLITETYENNEYGVPVPKVTETDVYCQVDSATRSEVYEGGRNGLNPEYRFTMFGPDYNDQKTVIYKGRAYGIYRTFIGRDDTIELYVERKGGTNGIGNT